MEKQNKTNLLVKREESDALWNRLSHLEQGCMNSLLASTQGATGNSSWHGENGGRESVYWKSVGFPPLLLQTRWDRKVGILTRVDTLFMRRGVGPKKSSLEKESWHLGDWIQRRKNPLWSWQSREIIKAMLVPEGRGRRKTGEAQWNGRIYGFQSFANPLREQAGKMWTCTPVKEESF